MVKLKACRTIDARLQIGNSDVAGLASNPDKQPWTYGEPYTTINRASLKLKSRLAPYFYSLCREAYDLGVPVVRAMALEFPSDEFLTAKYGYSSTL